MKTNISKHRLMEIAGLINENTSDRDAIAHFVWGREELMEKSEQEIERIIDDLEEEWNASKGNYSNVMDYLDDLEDNGGLEAYLDENINEDYSTMSLKSNIDQKWKTADDMAGDMQQWLSSVYSSGGESMYQEIMGILGNLVDNFDPEDEM